MPAADARLTPAALYTRRVVPGASTGLVIGRYGRAYRRSRYLPTARFTPGATTLNLHY